MDSLGAGYITTEEAEELLESLVELEAVELQILLQKEDERYQNLIRKTERDDMIYHGVHDQEVLSADNRRNTLVRIPYMMNDAVEYYLELQNCTVRGEWDAEEGVDDYSFVENGDSRGLILRQFSGNTVTIWYRKIFCMAECYQYHRIGHNWRKSSGEENLRRLVNLLCVMHDKVNYLGGCFCNETERELFELAEFGPLRFFTPINESILEWYPDTEAGAKAMLRLTEKAGDEEYGILVKRYLEDLHSGRKLDRKIKSLARELLQKSHTKIYETLHEEIAKASEKWKVRDYGQKKNEDIYRYISQIEKKYQNLGYQGKYPVLKKQMEKTEYTVEFVEEHPFTVLEYEDYDFRIFSMKYEKNHPYSVEMKEEEFELFSHNISINESNNKK